MTSPAAAAAAASSVPYASSITHGPPLYPPPADIPGLPTLAELRAVDVLFDWPTLKRFIREGDLGKLKRHPDLQRRYDLWTEQVKHQFGGGSTERYILTKRLHFPKLMAVDTPPAAAPVAGSSKDDAPAAGADEPRFDSRTPASDYCIAANDWPYSMPHDVYHFLVWTQLPLVPASQLTPELNEIGVFGFTGASPLADGEPTAPADVADEGRPGDVGFELGTFVRERWTEDEWETAWFMNPPRLQSVKLLPHFHVFARLKAGVDA